MCSSGDGIDVPRAANVRLAGNLELDSLNFRPIRLGGINRLGEA
jgi:hypothetical protein